jgi:bifunctional UDP-N-acetylglucosamine pyrophosphorylase/glucosamine-1-phosphate N-acetyltransferase
LPKVLHPVGGRPILAHVIDTSLKLTPEIGVVYGHGGEHVQSLIRQPSLKWHRQDRQLGTGHALMQALPDISPSQTVLVLYGDVPLIRAGTLEDLLAALKKHSLCVLSVVLNHPVGYGRIIRDERGELSCIVEDRDASEAQKSICEVNTGILAARAADLGRWLSQIRNDNAKGEYYLTDCVELAVQEGLSATALACTDPQEVMGINDKVQLALCERAYQQRQTQKLMLDGATLCDPARVDIRGKVATGKDVSIDVNVVFEGEVELGDDVKIGPNCFLKDSRIGSGTNIKANTFIENADIGSGCQLGPFTRIRPETRLGNEVHLGNFVEVKRSTIDDNTKASHLSYLGDSKIGKRVNVGAGTITCNYDGANKYVTRIGDDAFIGSDTQFIAPVNVDEGATIGAGSTITRDAPAHQLTLSRADQVSIEGWQRPRKKDI